MSSILPVTKTYGKKLRQQQQQQEQQNLEKQRVNSDYLLFSKETPALDGNESNDEEEESEESTLNYVRKLLAKKNTVQNVDQTPVIEKTATVENSSTNEPSTSTDNLTIQSNRYEKVQETPKTPTPFDFADEEDDIYESAVSHSLSDSKSPKPIHTTENASDNTQNLDSIDATQVIKSNQPSLLNNSITSKESSRFAIQSDSEDDLFAEPSDNEEDSLFVTSNEKIDRDTALPSSTPVEEHNKNENTDSIEVNEDEAEADVSLINEELLNDQDIDDESVNRSKNFSTMQLAPEAIVKKKVAWTSFFNKFRNSKLELMESSDDESDKAEENEQHTTNDEFFDHDSDNFMSNTEGHSSPISSPILLSDHEEELLSKGKNKLPKFNSRSQEARQFLAARNAPPTIKTFDSDNGDDDDSDFELEILPPVQEIKDPARQILKKISALSGRAIPIAKPVTTEAYNKQPTNSKDLMKHLVYAQQKQIQEDREDRMQQYKKLSSNLGKVQDSEEKKALAEYENSLLWEKAKKKAAMIRKQEKQKEREMMLKKKQEEDLNEGDESDIEEEEEEYDDDDAGDQPMEFLDYEDNEDKAEPPVEEQEDLASNPDEELKLPDDHRLKHRTTKRRVIFDDDEDEESNLVIQSPSQIVSQDDDNTQTAPPATQKSNNNYQDLIHRAIFGNEEDEYSQTTSDSGSKELPTFTPLSPPQRKLQNNNLQGYYDLLDEKEKASGVIIPKTLNRLNIRAGKGVATDVNGGDQTQADSTQLASTQVDQTQAVSNDLPLDQTQPIFATSQVVNKTMTNKSAAETYATQEIQNEDKDDLFEIEDIEPIKPKPRSITRRYSNASDDNLEDSVTPSSDELPTSAQPILKKKKQNRELSKEALALAKEMFEEEAVESEDEWAGIGGDDEDEVQDEEAERLEQERIARLLINDNDETLKGVDAEEKVANVNRALFLEKQLEADEKITKELFEMADGGWRKKHGGRLNGKFGLGDSDDDEDMFGELGDEELSKRRMLQIRRLKKQREAARKQLEGHTNAMFLVNRPKAKAFIDGLFDISAGDIGDGDTIAREIFGDDKILDTKADSEDEVEDDETQDSKKLSSIFKKNLESSSSNDNSKSVTREGSVDSESQQQDLPRMFKTPTNSNKKKRRHMDIQEIRNQLSFLDDPDRNGSIAAKPKDFETDEAETAKEFDVNPSLSSQDNNNDVITFDDDNDDDLWITKSTTFGNALPEDDDDLQITAQQETADLEEVAYFERRKRLRSVTSTFRSSSSSLKSKSNNNSSMVVEGTTTSNTTEEGNGTTTSTIFDMPSTTTKKSFQEVKVTVGLPGADISGSGSTIGRSSINYQRHSSSGKRSTGLTRKSGGGLSKMSSSKLNSNSKLMSMKPGQNKNPVLQKLLVNQRRLGGTSNKPSWKS